MLDRPEVVTLGEAMALFLAEPGAAVSHARWFDASVAGAEANVAIGLSRLGHRVAYVGRVGADPMGVAVLRTLRGEAVDVTGVVTDPERPTGLLIRDAPAGQPIQVVYRRSGSAGSALCVEDLPEAALAAAPVVHLTGITAVLSDSARDAVRAAADPARHVVFDPNIRLRLASVATWRSLVEEFAPLVDTVLVGAEELTLLDLEPAWFIERGAAVVVVKDGGRGAWATDGTQTWKAPARAVPVVDPVGAGDAFAAGWVSGLLRDVPV
ncbi:MAG: sugar kinase, partial [Micromonosporaceae bacterium]